MTQLQLLKTPISTKPVQSSLTLSLAQHSLPLWGGSNFGLVHEIL